MEIRMINNLTGEEIIVEVEDEVEPVAEPTPTEPTLEERLAETESKVATIEEIVEVLYG